MQQICLIHLVLMATKTSLLTDNRSISAKIDVKDHYLEILGISCTNEKTCLQYRTSASKLLMSPKFQALEGWLRK